MTKRLKLLVPHFSVSCPTSAVIYKNGMENLRKSTQNLFIIVLILGRRGEDQHSAVQGGGCGTWNQQHVLKAKNVAASFDPCDKTSGPHPLANHVGPS